MLFVLEFDFALGAPFDKVPLETKSMFCCLIKEIMDYRLVCVFFFVLLSQYV